MTRFVKMKANGAVREWIDGLDPKRYDLLTDQETMTYFATIGVDSRSEKFSGTGTPTNLERDDLCLYSSARGLGDAISALYVACGYAKAGRRTTLYSYFPHIVGITHTENLIILPEPPRGANCNVGYKEQLTAAAEVGTTRCEWLSSNIAKAYGIEQVPCERPDALPFFDLNDTVVMSPFSIHAGRAWHPANWARLGKELQRAGRKVLVVAQKHDEQTCRDVFGSVGVDFELDLPTEKLLALVGGAALVIGNDSGIAHLGGLLGRPTLALLAATTHRYLYDMAPSVRAVEPPAPAGCSPCFWQAPKVMPMCNRYCSPLQTIGVFQVLDRAIESLGAKRAAVRAPNTGKRKAAIGGD
jgi:hypothetical protein